MHIGAIFTGLAAAALLVFYITEPFRKKTQDIDVLINQWVASVSDSSVPIHAIEPVQNVHTSQQVSDSTSADEESSAKFCHYCGQPIKSEHRFCPNCGTNLTN